MEGENSENKKEAEKKIDYSKQTKIVIACVICALLIIAVVFFVSTRRQKISYNGIEFYTEKGGNTVFYKSLLGYASVDGRKVPFTLQLRNDPKKLAKIPVEGDITLLKESIISLSPETTNCTHTYLTLIGMGMSLQTFGSTPSQAVTDKDFASMTNQTYADCSFSDSKTVIIFKEGNKTKIVQQQDFPNCYIIELKDCDINAGYEKFLLEFISRSFEKP